MTEKLTNPKDLVGIRKVPASCLSAAFKLGVSLGMMEGARKYGRHNYRQAGVAASVYYDAANRHLDAFWEGQDIDPDSGLHHLLKAAASIAVLYDGIIYRNWTDDRPPALPEGWLADLNERASVLIDKYPTPKAPVTQAVIRGQPMWAGPGKTQEAGS